MLYPRDMSIYGDRGNTLTLTKRLGWHGYEVELLSHNPGDQLPEQVDILVGGGGQDSAQERIQDDLQKVAPQLRAWASDGVPAGCISSLGMSSALWAGRLSRALAYLTHIPWVDLSA